ncbi:hypothetical protein [Streptomyces odontomachi]|uniref:hypothetical protein n=1 Tax=Streptomyces odontomachi TaxID=2944940 RepID=UPI00210DECBD|nr:hypothetical protein [Streptomyces sp. ODS25]
MDNARAQQLMLGTRCADCGHIGYDMETYFLPSWYLGRCPDCGHSREFTFPS